MMLLWMLFAIVLCLAWWPVVFAGMWLLRRCVGWMAKKKPP